MEGLRHIVDGIDDLYLRKIALREVILIEEGMMKWQTRVEEMKKMAGVLWMIKKSYLPLS
ncbi:MAG: hypothetical protein ABH870_03215 [bacterium]